MDKPKLIEKLNEAVALELGALLQYNQYSQMIVGRDRITWADWFHERAEGAFKHARMVGGRVAALGGTPSVEPEAVRQTKDLQEMLENSLEVERRAVQVYSEALAFCKDHPGYRNMLEGLVDDETQDVEELEKFLNRLEQVHEQAAEGRVSRAKSA
jgi:bacterioferritin